MVKKIYVVVYSNHARWNEDRFECNIRAFTTRKQAERWIANNPLTDEEKQYPNENAAYDVKELNLSSIK